VYELTGPRLWNFDDLARLVGEATGRPIRHVRAADEELGWWAGVFRSVRDGGFSNVSTDLERLLGRPPGAIESVVRRQYATHQMSERNSP
jgi:uncharacterized protein YbjT (DUF2867 family)